MWSHHAFTCTSSFPQIWSKDASPLWHKFEWVPETIKLCFSWMFWYLLEKGCIDFRLFVSVFGLAYTCTRLCICTYTICFVLLVGMSAGVRPHAALSGVTMSLPAAFTRTWTRTHHIHTHTPVHTHSHQHTCTHTHVCTVHTHTCIWIHYKPPPITPLRFIAGCLTLRIVR